MKKSKIKIFIVLFIPTFLGLLLIQKLSVNLNPSNASPSITVDFDWPNASSNILERDVTSVLEANFNILRNLQGIYSKSSRGSGLIRLDFKKNVNIDIARFEVATIIRQVYRGLPPETSYPNITINRTEDEDSKSFLSYSIKANASPFEIQNIVKTIIEPKIGIVQDIDKTEIYGANPIEVVITYNQQKLKALNLEKQLIISALNNALKKEALGIVNLKGFISLVIQPQAKTINWHIPVVKIQNKIIYLDEIASVQEKEQEAKSYYRINGANAITLNVYATKKANTIVLAEKINTIINNLQDELPFGYSINKTYDSSEYLKQELNKIYDRSVYTVLILFLFILIVSKSFKYLLVTFISIVTNLGIAFLLYYIFSVEIQLYSLAGITISLGLIIDNSIVMIDHIRHQNNKSVFIPILASTLTTIGALSVIYFLDDKYKFNLIDFAVVIIINLLVSLIIALTLIPALLENISLPLKKEKSWFKKLKFRFYSIYSSIIFFEFRFKRLLILLIILVFGIPFFMLPKKLDNNKAWYEKTYNSTLGSEWYLEHLRPDVDKYFGGTFRLFNNYVFDKAYYSRNEETKLYVTASMEKGSTVHQMNSVFILLENYLRQFGGIKNYNSQIYSGDYGSLEITFRDDAIENSLPITLKSRLIRRVLDFGGIEWNVYGVGKGYSSGEGVSEPVNFSVKAKGYNYNELNDWSDTLKLSLEANPRIQKVIIRENTLARKPSYEYIFSLNKESMAMAKVSPLKLVDGLQEATLSKDQDLSLNISGKYTPIRLESDQSKHFDIWHIKNTPLDSLHTPIVLKDIAKVSKEREEENIYKENQEYLRVVDVQYNGSQRFGSKFLDDKLEELEGILPLGYSFERSEQQWSFNSDKSSNYILLLIFILGIIYCICSILFESFKQPFIILSVIPISFIGVFLTFYLFDFNFDQGGLASFVLLSGITVNASIFIINGFNKLKKEFPNKDKIELYLESFKQKIFPIMLTIISTILGFIPFVKDGQNEVFWFALAVGTIGGLIFSMIGILFYLPIFTLKKVS